MTDYMDEGWIQSLEKKAGLRNRDFAPINDTFNQGYEKAKRDMATESKKIYVCVRPVEGVYTKPLLVTDNEYHAQLFQDGATATHGTIDVVEYTIGIVEDY